MFQEGFKTYKCKYIPGQNLYGNYGTKGKTVGEGIPKLEIDEGLFEEVRTLDSYLSRGLSDAIFCQLSVL